MTSSANQYTKLVLADSCSGVRFSSITAPMTGALLEVCARNHKVKNAQVEGGKETYKLAWFAAPLCTFCTEAGGEKKLSPAFNFLRPGNRAVSLSSGSQTVASL